MYASGKSSHMECHFFFKGMNMHTSKISTRPFMIVKTKNNSTIQKKNLFPIIVSHIKKQKPYKRIGKQKNFWLDTKPKLLQACFKHFLAGKHQKLCSTNICKLNASITHQGPLELVLCCKINTLQFNNCSHTNTKNVCIIQTLIPYKAL